MRSDREILENDNWLKSGELPIIKRLSYLGLKENPAPQVNSNNIAVRDAVFEEIIANKNQLEILPDFLSDGQSNDLVIAEIDRYGLPHRTVINRETGLIRTDPYYSQVWLNKFYSSYYRDLYSNQVSHKYSSVLSEQIKRGEYYYDLIKSRLKGSENVLEIGCGMGGILVPFKINGFAVKGIDLGEKYIGIGNKFNLNLHFATIEDICLKGEKFDLIILSHIIEHIPDLLSFFNNIKKILHPGGLIFIAVPGIKKMHETYNQNIQMYLQNAHCWSFSEYTLNKALNKFGFNTVYSDENINCLASMGDVKSVTVVDEAASILNYLKKTELNYLNNKSLKSRIINRIIKNIKIK